jgi:hypothetical protein
MDYSAFCTSEERVPTREEHREFCEKYCKDGEHDFLCFEYTHRDNPVETNTNFYRCQQYTREMSSIEPAPCQTINADKWPVLKIEDATTMCRLCDKTWDNTTHAHCLGCHETVEKSDIVHNCGLSAKGRLEAVVSVYEYTKMVEERMAQEEKEMPEVDFSETKKKIEKAVTYWDETVMEATEALQLPPAPTALKKKSKKKSKK